MYFSKYISLCIDLLFPPSADELCVRNLSYSDLMHHMSITDTAYATYLFSYKNKKVRALLWQLKYKNDTKAAELLGTALRDYLASRYKTPHILIPLPLSRTRFLERGYNQVESIADVAARHIPYISIEKKLLIRSAHTKPQTKLGRSERLTNMRGVFTLADHTQIDNKAFILLDDVTTTGASLREARDTLLSAGAASVDCIAIAH